MKIFFLVMTVIFALLMMGEKDKGKRTDFLCGFGISAVLTTFIYFSAV